MGFGVKAMAKREEKEERIEVRGLGEESIAGNGEAGGERGQKEVTHGSRGSRMWGRWQKGLGEPNQVI